MALRPAHDFDKLEALALAQDLVRISSFEKHEKPTYYAVRLEEMRSRLAKPPSLFKAYYSFSFICGQGVRKDYAVSCQGK